MQVFLRLRPIKSSSQLSVTDGENAIVAVARPTLDGYVNRTDASSLLYISLCSSHSITYQDYEEVQMIDVGSLSDNSLISR